MHLKPWAGPPPSSTSCEHRPGSRGRNRAADDIGERGHAEVDSLLNAAQGEANARAQVPTDTFRFSPVAEELFPFLRRYL